MKNFLVKALSLGLCIAAVAAYDQRAVGSSTMTSALLGLSQQQMVPALKEALTNGIESADGLFKVVADEEKRIREDPVARTSELLRRVFGVLRSSPAATSTRSSG